MRCLIIAAGQGSRLRRWAEVKPLVPIFGVPLIERVVRSAVQAGADDLYVVSGYKGEHVRSFLDQLSEQLSIPITHVVNEQWEKENGLSVLKARRYLDERFLLLMSDHIFDPAIARDLLSQNLRDGEILLAVDHDIGNPLVDMRDVTRVQTLGGRIVQIGKGLAEFNAFDTGIFLCSPTIFKALEESAELYQDTTLSGAVRVLASAGRARAVDTRGRFWIDVDDAASYRRAELALLSRTQEKTNDGPVSRLLNRPISIRISRYLAKTPVTPNQVTTASFFLCVVAAVLFMLGGYPRLLAGGLLAQFASILDGCDGELARLRGRESPFGKWFDAVLDRYADAFLLFGLAWHSYFETANNLHLFVGFLAIIGSFMVSYTADKYDGLMQDRFSGGRSFRIGRDMRVLLIALGAALNQPFPILLVLALIMNGEAIRRIWICQRHGQYRTREAEGLEAHLRLKGAGGPPARTEHP